MIGSGSGQTLRPGWMLSTRIEGAMARYFSDTLDGETRIEDEVGIDLDGIEAAQVQTQEKLADFARDELPDTGTRRTLSIFVRDEAGMTVLRTAFSVAVEIAPSTSQAGGAVAPRNVEHGSRLRGEKLEEPDAASRPPRPDARGERDRLHLPGWPE